MVKCLQYRETMLILDKTMCFWQVRLYYWKQCYLLIECYRLIFMIDRVCLFFEYETDGCFKFFDVRISSYIIHIFISISKYLLNWAFFQIEYFIEYRKSTIDWCTKYRFQIIKLRSLLEHTHTRTSSSETI